MQVPIFTIIYFCTIITLSYHKVKSKGTRVTTTTTVTTTTKTTTFTTTATTTSAGQKGQYVQQITHPLGKQRRAESERSAS